MTDTENVQPIWERVASTEDLLGKLSAIEVEGGGLKVKLFNQLKQQYVDFEPLLEDSASVYKQALQYRTQLENVFAAYKRTQTELDEHERQSVVDKNRLLMLKRQLRVIEVLAAIHKCLETLNACPSEAGSTSNLEPGLIIRAADNYHRLRSLMKKLQNEVVGSKSSGSIPIAAEEQKVLLLSSLETEAQLHLENVVFLLEKVWRRVAQLTWTEVEDDGDGNNLLRGTLTLMRSELNEKLANDFSTKALLECFAKLDVLDQKATSFLRLFSSFVGPLFLRGGCFQCDARNQPYHLDYVKQVQTVVTPTKGKKKRTAAASPLIRLQIDIVLKNTGAAATAATDCSVFDRQTYYLQTVERLITVSQAVIDSFACCPFLGESGAETTLVRLLSDELNQKIVVPLTGDVFADSIPNNLADMDDFQQNVKSKLDELMSLLGSSKLQLLNDESKQRVEKAVRGASELFLRRHSAETLRRARVLIVEDLTNHCETGAAAYNDNDNSNGENMFSFPLCQVSQGALAVVELLDSLIGEVQSGSISDVSYVTELLDSSRSVFELYLAIARRSHESEISNSLFSAALFFNNSNLLAHHCMSFGYRFYCALAPIRESGQGGINDHLALPTLESCSMVDLLLQLRHCGTAVLKDAVDKKSAQLCDGLYSGVDGFLECSDSKSLARCKNYFKQIQSELKNFTDTLVPCVPSAVFRSNLGSIVDSLASEMCRLVFRLEDIRSKDSDVLAGLFLEDFLAPVALCFLRDRSDYSISSGDDGCGQASSVNSWSVDGSRLGRSEAESVISRSKIHLLKNVPSYTKITELIFLLQSNMAAIVERWSDGFGPLAAIFDAGSVRKLIRALFQNSDSRDAVLSKIQ